MTIAVITKPGQRVEDLLKAYDKKLVVPPYVKYTRQEAIDYVHATNPDMAEISDDECWHYIADYAYDIDPEGNIYSIENQNGKFSSYSILTSEPIGNHDFGTDMGIYEWALKYWDEVIEHQPVDSGKRMVDITEEEMRELYSDRDDFANRISRPITDVVVTPDSFWHEACKEGYWPLTYERAIDKRSWDEHYRERFVDTAEPDWILSMVDCED